MEPRIRLLEIRGMPVRIAGSFPHVLRRRTDRLQKRTLRGGIVFSAHRVLFCQKRRQGHPARFPRDNWTGNMAIHLAENKSVSTLILVRLRVQRGHGDDPISRGTAGADDASRTSSRLPLAWRNGHSGSVHSSHQLVSFLDAGRPVFVLSSASMDQGTLF